MRFVGSCELLLCGVAMLLAGPAARADLTCNARFGWEAHVRTPRWNPVFVQVQDSSPHTIDIELSGSRDNSQSITTTLPGNAGPIPQTYVLYAPLLVEREPVFVRIFDAQTHKKLIEQKLFDPDASTYGPVAFQGGSGGPFEHHTGGLFIGVSGRERALKELGSNVLVDNSSNTSDRSTVAFVPQYELPAAVKGYDALDVLVLNQPDLNTMESAQRKAILDWVRGGGELLVWFGAAPLATDDPIARALPCAIGDNTGFDISASDLNSAGLPARFAKLGGRVLVPKADAMVLPLLGGNGAKCVYNRYGFGQIGVISFDASALLFLSTRQAYQFWKPILTAAPAETLLAEDNSRTYRDGSNAENAAINRVTDLLGGVPGVGTFGFGYVAVTLIALMLIVGPIDWLLLKWLGHQPWTWVTTTGWIALITLLAIYIGHLFRSGDLQVRTLRVAEQVDGSVVAQTDFVGIYSPRTDDYDLEPAPNSWWEPLTADTYGGGRRGLTQFNYWQTARQSVPDPRNPMTIPVWNLRFLRGESTEKSSPIVTTKLIRLGSQKNAQGGTTVKVPQRIKGTITNLTDTPLIAPWLRAYGYTVSKTSLSGNALLLQPGDVWPDTIPAHGTVNVDVALVNPVNLQSGDSSPNQVEMSSTAEGVDMDAPTLIRVAENLSWSRRSRVEEVMFRKRDATSYPDIANFCAVSMNCPPAATLKNRTAIQKNWLMVRALVPVSSPDGNQ